MGNDVITNVISAPPPEPLEKLAPGEGGGGYSPTKVTGVLVGKFRKHPEKVPESFLWACSKFISNPKRYQFNHNKLYNWRCKF